MREPYRIFIPVLFLATVFCTNNWARAESLDLGTAEITDPLAADSLTTIESSGMNLINFRKPFFEAGGMVWNNYGKATDIKPWRLTEVFENLSDRFWPSVQIEKIPDIKTMSESDKKDYLLRLKNITCNTITQNLDNQNEYIKHPQLYFLTTDSSKD